MKLFQPNINDLGRVLRALGGVVCAASCAFLWPHSRTASLLLGAAAAFMFFEAARGWCAARACGIKTPI